MPATISCEPSDLVAAAKCFDCIPQDMRDAVELYLLATIAGGSMDPATLVAAAKCFDCVPKGMREPLKEYLLCQIVNT